MMITGSSTNCLLIIKFSGTPMSWKSCEFVVAHWRIQLVKWFPS